MKEAVDDIMVTLNEAASEVGMVGGMVESIAESIGRVSKGLFCSKQCMFCVPVFLWLFEVNQDVVFICSKQIFFEF